MDGYTGPTDVRNLGPAVVATGAWVGFGLALDAYLIIKRKDCVITDVLRTKPGKALLIVLGLHVVNCLGPVDPFRFAANVLTGHLGAAASELTDALPGK